ncbi:PadR family transcriptional regulator [Microtetraspora niveoalba]|uniref:PadR family transcriptional regulator n=1 Tax=Microtetraspora niveoalba TaxID=46175 RepID=UPI00083400B8|nr:PadR family transcriptional regulator [Microtetraspora niveoalba]
MQRSDTEPDTESGTEPGAVRLPATAWAVLGILSFEGELTGYEIRKWTGYLLRFFYWSPAMSQIYQELKRLERVGYATSRQVTGGDGRDKRVYVISEAGTRALTDWAENVPVEPPVVKHGTALRVWLGHLATPERLREVVEAHRDDAGRMLDEAEFSRRTVADVPGWAYQELAARWAVRHYASERDLAERMLADLETLAARRR